MKVWLAALALTVFACAAAAQSVPSELDGYTFQISNGVSDRDSAFVLARMAEAHRYFERFGVQLSDQQRKRFVTKIVASGKGNQEKGGGGGCCMSQSELNKVGPRLFFDVAHKDWPRDPGRRSATIYHEYTHGIQSSLGVKSWTRSLMADWMEEGMAEYYAQEIAIQAGNANRGEVERRIFNWARNGDVFRYSLKQLEPNNRPTHPGNLGYLAVVGLVETSEHGRAAPLVYMQLLKKRGKNRAFEEAFGIDRGEFYRRFAAWQEAVQQGRTKVAVWSRM